MNNFKVGDRVIRKDSVQQFNEYENDSICGVVKSLGMNGAITVKWDSEYINPNPQTLDYDKLLTEAEGNEKWSALEAEYEVWAAPIRDKMKEAGALLKEAGLLAKKQKRDLTELHELTGPLLSAMDNIGWSTSSLSC